MTELPLIGEAVAVAAARPRLAGAKIGVVTFPGTLDDRDAARAVRLAGATPVAALARGHHARSTSTPSSFPAVSPTATTSAPAPSPGSRR